MWTRAGSGEILVKEVHEAFHLGPILSTSEMDCRNPRIGRGRRLREKPKPEGEGSGLDQHEDDLSEGTTFAVAGNGTTRVTRTSTPLRVTIMSRAPISHPFGRRTDVLPAGVDRLGR